MESDKLDRIAEGVARIDQKTEGLKDWVTAVSANVSEIRRDLVAHKESTEAHGQKAARGVLDRIASWASLGVAAVLAYVELRRK